MRPINLLPPEAFERSAGRRRVFRLALIAVLYLIILGLLFVMARRDTADIRQAVADQQAVNIGLQAQLADMQGANDLVVRYDEDAALIEAVLTADVSWGRILNDLGRMIPDRVWLNGFQGRVDLDPASPAEGSFQVTGTGFGFGDVAAWLRSLDSDRFPSVAGTWVSTVSGDNIGDIPVVSFESQTSLTAAALTERVEERIPEVGR